MKRLVLAFLVTSWSISANAQTQSVHPRTDPRPLKGLKQSSLPPTVTYDEVIKQSVPGGALRGSQYVGQAHIVSIPVVSSGTFQATPSSTPTGLWKVLRAANGTVNWMWRLGDAGSEAQTVASAGAPNQTLNDLKDILRIKDPASEFVLQRDERDELGERHMHYVQVYKGVPVWQRDIAAHFDRNGNAMTVNGTYEPTPSIESVQPSITPSSAITAATDDLRGTGEWSDDDAATLLHFGITKVKAALALYPEGRSMRLIFDVDVHPNILEEYDYIVDAHTGEIVHRIALHCSLVPEKNVHAPHITGFAAAAPSGGKFSALQAGFSNSSGTDLNGKTRQFRSYLNTDGFYYMAWDLSNYDGGKSTPPDNLVGGGLTIDLQSHDAGSNAQYFNVTSQNNSWSDRAAISAHCNMDVCYEYYRSTFNRGAIDGKNGTILSTIHVTENGQNMENAYWNGSMMLYGDGETVFKPLAGGLDVAGHEMTHGVTASTANLLYQDQSGALNESMSDVFGVMIDTTNLVVGEDIMRPGQGSFLRSLENPADPNAFSKQPATMADYQQLGQDQDNGGVHTNSGIPNHAAALIIKAIGRPKAQKIYYQALTKYLTRNSQFVDARIACESAAKDFYGSGSAEQKAVSDAFAAVGIGGSASNDNNNVPPQTGGTDYIAFLDPNGQVGALQPASKQAALFSSSAAVARISSGGADRAELSAPRNGADIWFVSPNGLLTYIQSATGQVFNFPNLSIQQSGDIWNASVSPDESFVALASSYSHDPNIYIYNGSTITRIALTPQTQDGGAQQTIQYPDVMNWSPNSKLPRIGFDAFNSQQLSSGTTLDYWSMYEVSLNKSNVSSSPIFELVPSQPEGIDIGNITYSKLNPDVVAYNIVTGSESDILLSDFQKGASLDLNVTQQTLNGNPITDGERPSFSPDDRYLCFTSTANNAILYFDGTTMQFSFLGFQQPLYNPCWMLVGGVAAVHSPAYEFSTLDIYPSIARAKAEAHLTLRESARCKVELLNSVGVIARTTYSGVLLAGENTISLDLSGLSAGMYLVRISDGTSESYGKVIVE